MIGKQIFTLEELQNLANAKGSVVVPDTTFKKPCSAAFLINLQGHYLVRLFAKGIFIYEKPKKERQEDHDTDR